MDNRQTPKLNIVSSTQATFSGVYYILTLTKENDTLVNREEVEINSKEDFTALLGSINQYNNEHDDSYRKLVK